MPGCTRRAPRAGIIAGLTLLVGAVLAVAPANAGSAATKVPPNACKTFTMKSVDLLFGISTRAHPSVKLSKSGSGAYLTSVCTVTWRKKTLTVRTFLTSGGSGGPLVCYRRPRLGTDGRVCLPSLRQYHFTDVEFMRHGVFVSDFYNVTLPRQGQSLYSFALAQAPAIRG